MKSGFLDKLIDRLDKIDPRSLQTQFLRLAQERGLLETIFQSIQEGVMVVSGSGKVDYANRAAEQMLGFTMDGARGRPVGRYLRDVDWDRILRLDASEWSRLIAQEIEITYPEHRFVNFYVVPLVPAHETEKGAVVILRDVTRDRRQEASLLESERINAIKLLAAGVAHEIGNPLNALTIHLQLLDRELQSLGERLAAPPPPPRRPGRPPAAARRAAPPSPPVSPADMQGLLDLARVARTEVGRLDSIITQFLRAIRPARPKLVPSRIDAILNETLELLKHEIQDRRIAVAVDCPADLPRVPADRDQLKQAFFNVIRNALQAMPDGGSLHIALFVSDRHLGVSFRDTGAGIRREDFGRVFEPYYTTKPGGSGLGLMIVQRIVQDHGGQIELVSKPAEGTRLTLLLPLAERGVRLLKSGA